MLNKNATVTVRFLSGYICEIRSSVFLNKYGRYLPTVCTYWYETQILDKSRMGAVGTVPYYSHAQTPYPHHLAPPVCVFSALAFIRKQWNSSQKQHSGIKEFKNSSDYLCCIKILHFEIDLGPKVTI